MSSSYDAILILSFGGPEGMDDVMPFLQNVTRGRNVPAERLIEVAHHYELFNGVSPINQQNRTIIAALQKELNANGPDLPIYWGNRNWNPYLKDTMAQMKADGIKSALAFVTSAYSSYSSCRQYLDDIQRAQNEVGDGAPQIDKIRPFYNHPLFIEANVDQLKLALEKVPEGKRDQVRLIFTAHSVPKTMAAGCNYSTQLLEAGQLISEKCGIKNWELAYQSRSGPPAIPWLEPDILDAIKKQASEGIKEIVIQPIGFVSDHMEVIYDLDHEAKTLCDELGINMQRASTASTNSKFIAMIRELILERIEGTGPNFVGTLGALPDECAPDCCPLGATRPAVNATPTDTKH